MDHIPSKSPDTPQGSHNIARDEDSQESTTIRNAMQPIPDTQPDSQDYHQISPENHVTLNAPCISWPARPDADDLSVGFTYNKPSAIMPGQFSGRKHKKPINTIPGEASVATVGPDNAKQVPLEQEAAFDDAAAGRGDPTICPRLLLPQGRGTIQDHAKMPEAQNFQSRIPGYQISQSIQSCQRPQTTEDMPTPISLSRKKRPFVDYQPTYRASGQHTEIHTQATSFVAPPAPDQTLGSSSEHNLPPSKGVDTHSSNQRHPVNTNTVDMPQKKLRTSLQNDVSVSSAHPPRTLPGSSPRAALIHRPMKDSHRRTSRLCTPAKRQRSGESFPRSNHSIVKSNSKAKRTSNPVQVSSSPRSSSHLAHDDEVTPLMRQRLKWMPAEMIRERFHQKMATTATDLAGCFNDKFADIQAEVDQHLQTISDLKKGMSEQRNDMSRYKECILGRDNKILQLEETCDQLLAKVESTKQELDARSSNISKLEKKCHSYKEFLNKAIAEQQELYKATKAKCDGTITQLRVEERQRIALQECERKHAEVTREELRRLVHSTVTEYKHKEQEFNNQIEVLNQKVQERDADVSRERKTAQALLEQNGSIKAIQDTLQTFGVQIEEVVGKVNEVVTQQSHQDDQSTQTINTKLDQIMQYLRVLDERTLAMADIPKEMHELNEKTVATISEKLEPILAAQLHTKISLDSLCSGIDDCMNDIWIELEDRQTVLEEFGHKQLDAEREQRAALIQEIEELERELDGQNQLLFRSEQSVLAQEATIDKLQLDIGGLIQAEEQHVAASKHLDQLRDECARLKGDSATKASLVTELRSKLQESTTNLAIEEQKHQEKIDELQRLMEQRVTEAKAAHVQAVEAAQQNAMLNMNEIKADIDSRLTQALEQRTALEKELEEAKQKVAMIEADSSKMIEKATALEEELQSSRMEADKGREHASLKDTEYQAAKEQHRKLIQDLQTQLASVEGRFNKLAGSAKSYDRAAQTVLLSLRQWTHDYASIQSLARELRRNSDKNGVLDHIDPTLKPLIELQLLQTAVSQYCQTQKEAVQMLSGESAAVKPASQVYPAIGSLEMATGSVLDRMRRVTVTSPASNASSPKPPSVQVEQERRRMGEQPKSILKLVRQLPQNSDEESRRELLSNTSINRGPYNRLVAGRKPQLAAARRSQQARSGSSSAFKQEFSTAPVAAGIRKREQAFDQDFEQESDRKRRTFPEREHSAKLMSRFSSPPKLELDRSQFEAVHVALPKTSWSTVNDEPLSSSAHSQSSQEQSQSQAVTKGFRIKTGNLFNSRSRSSQSSSNDPLALFFERRRSTHSREVSQESFANSQDLGDRDQHVFPTSRGSNFGS